MVSQKNRDFGTLQLLFYFCWQNILYIRVVEQVHKGLYFFEFCLQCCIVSGFGWWLLGTFAGSGCSQLH